MLSKLKAYFDPNKKEIIRLRQFAERVNSLEDRFKNEDISFFAKHSDDLRARVQEGADTLPPQESLALLDRRLEEVAEEAFAVCREVSKRVMGMRHFDVQMMGGKVLQEGRIAEMKTGEGKTLTATLPLYLNALAGRGAHLVTVNDYLAQRDRDWMNPIYETLGMTVGVIKHGLTDKQRQVAYSKDITYGTNNEFGFDYLRDNMEVDLESLRQRPHFYAIVDEVDSILVDEARTPLIISGQAEKSTDMYYRMAELIERIPLEDVKVEEKHHSAVLLEPAIDKLEKWLGIDNLYGSEHTELSHLATQGIKARCLYKKDVQYVVRDGEVVIVDEFTGRLMFGRRYGDGLHQAIEAREKVCFKEDVDIQRESLTLATITFQNYFRLYHRLSGMTGTAKTEEDEFRKIYGCDVVVVPTNQALARVDANDAIYKNQAGKYKAVVSHIKECHEKNQPVLVGTVSIEKSEMVGRLLEQEGIPHTVLNAKYHEREAHIVAQAGRPGGVTIATNMAGRGTDIVLGGNPEYMATDELADELIQEGAIPAGTTPEEARRVTDPEIWKTRIKDKIAKWKQQCEQDKEIVRAAGGLAILGTERHESRRIDNQLRGRSGRQGDPGSSRFFVSLDDDLMRLFGSEKLSGMMERMGMTEDEVIEHPWVTKSIETAQKKVEMQHFGARKQLLEFDDVMNVQREVIYRDRRRILDGLDISERLKRGLSEIAETMVNEIAPPDSHPEEWDLPALYTQVLEFLPFAPEELFNEEALKGLDRLGIVEKVNDFFMNLYQQKEEMFGPEMMRQVERLLFLRCIDEAWVEHLGAMDALKEGIFLRGYGQIQPIVAYQKEAYDMFQELDVRIRREALQRIFFVVPAMDDEEEDVAPIEVESVFKNVTTNREPEVENRVVRGMKKPKPNDACPCGSGKKFKKCYGTKTCGLYGGNTPW